MFDFVKASYLIFLGLPREKRDASEIRTHAGIPTDLGFQDQCITALPPRRRRFYAFMRDLSTMHTIEIRKSTVTGVPTFVAA